MKKLQESGVFKVVCACLFILGLYWAIESVIPSFRSLPVSGIDQARQQTTATAVSNDLKNLHLLVATPIKSPAPAAEPSEVISIDDAFIPKAQVVPSQQPAENLTPDYFAILKSSGLLQLQAISNTGAIISGHHYNYETPLTEFGYPASNGKMIAPIVRQSKKPDSIDIIENPGKNRFTISMSKS